MSEHYCMYKDGMCELDVDEAYQQGRADALNIDMEKPMHFTNEQKTWVKKYIIINAKRQRSDTIDKYNEKIKECCSIVGSCDFSDLDRIAKQLKEEI